MSLINKMLQDLDARNASPGRERPALGASPAVAAPSPLARYGRGALLVLLGGAVAATAWLFLRPNANAARLATVKPIEAPPPILAAASVAAPQASAPAGDFTVAPAPALAPAPAPAPAPLSALVSTTVAALAPARTVDRGRAPAQAAAPVTAAETPATTPPAPPSPSKNFKQTSPLQDSDNAYRAAVAQYQQGNVEEARRSLVRALDRNPSNGRARQMLVGLNIDGGQLEEAARLLRQGLQLQPEESGLAMALARLQLETGDTTGATATMAKNLPAAGDDAAYNALYAVLLQRAQAHDEAIKHYLVALKSDPAKPTWLVGIGASLQATGRKADAIAAYTRARDGGMLPTSLQDYVEGQLEQLKR